MHWTSVCSCAFSSELHELVRLHNAVTGHSMANAFINPQQTKSFTFNGCNAWHNTYWPMATALLPHSLLTLTWTDDRWWRRAARSLQRTWTALLCSRGSDHTSSISAHAQTRHLRGHAHLVQNGQVIQSLTSEQDDVAPMNTDRPNESCLKRVVISPLLWFTKFASINWTLPQCTQAFEHHNLKPLLAGILPIVATIYFKQCLNFRKFSTVHSH